jgi:hypothetical protein
MRGLRSFIVLLVIAAGLGAYIYFVESKRNPNEPATREKVFSIDASAIRTLDVKTESGDQTKLEKTGDTWTIVAPVKAIADTTEVSGMASSLASLEIQRVVDEKPADYAQYGLVTPRIEIGFTTGTGSAEQRLQIGSKTPTGGDMYARLAGQDRVFLVPAYLDTTFDKKTFDLRDKAILKFTRANVDAIDISSDEKSVKLAKAGGNWRLVSPWPARAEFGTVEGLIGRLESGRMAAIVTDQVEDPAKYGLDKPAATVEVVAGSSKATLEIGKAAEGDKVYARDASRPVVFTIDKSLVDDVDKPAVDYRQKDLFEFRPFNATRVEITRGGKTIVFEKVKGEKGETWQETAPDKKTPDSTKLESGLSALSGLQAASFVDSTRNTGVDAPVLTVSVSYGDGDAKKTERVAFGRSGGDVYASPDGEPGAAKVDTSAFDSALKALDAIT